MTRPFFFGYGSLVNRNTHAYGDSATARLQGWRRVWRQTTYDPIPILTAEPCEGWQIDGLIAHVPNGDWQALDAREHAYDRVPVTARVTHTVTDPIQIATYTVPHDKYPAPATHGPILQSYLDTVVLGYLQEFGEEGALEFFASTVGWNCPIRQDRAAPQYPRTQTPTPKQADFIDTHTAKRQREDTETNS